MAKRQRLFLIGTSLLLLVGIRCAQAAEIKVVSPSAYANIEGAGVTNADCCPPFRYQQVFPAADFAALGNQPHWIVGFTTRTDQIATSPGTAQFPDNEIRLSTTQRGPSNLSLRFDENLGSDVKQFYRGALIQVAPGPREFKNPQFPAGVTPYLYDPRQGNLLFDVMAWQGVTSSSRDDKVPGIQTALYATSPTATQGARDAASVFQFTFIPVPEPSSLALSAVLLVLGLLCPRATTTKMASSMPPTR